jgi:hypothetical protein
MATSRGRAQRRADPRVIPPAGIEDPSSIAGVGPARSPAVVTTEDIDWLVGHLRAMVTASPAVWAGRQQLADV